MSVPSRRPLHALDRADPGRPLDESPPWAVRRARAARGPACARRDASLGHLDKAATYSSELDALLADGSLTGSRAQPCRERTGQPRRSTTARSVPSRRRPGIDARSLARRAGDLEEEAGVLGTIGGIEAHGAGASMSALDALNEALDLQPTCYAWRRKHRPTRTEQRSQSAGVRRSLDALDEAGQTKEPRRRGRSGEQSRRSPLIRRAKVLLARDVLEDACKSPRSVRSP